MFVLDACCQVSDKIQLIMNMLDKALFNSSLHCGWNWDEQLSVKFDVA